MRNNKLNNYRETWITAEDYAQYQSRLSEGRCKTAIEGKLKQDHAQPTIIVYAACKSAQQEGWYCLLVSTWADSYPTGLMVVPANAKIYLYPDGARRDTRYAKYPVAWTVSYLDLATDAQVRGEIIWQNTYASINFICQGTQFLTRPPSTGTINTTRTGNMIAAEYIHFIAAMQQAAALIDKVKVGELKLRVYKESELIKQEES